MQDSSDLIMEKWLMAYKSSNICEMGKDRTKVTIEDQLGVL